MKWIIGIVIVALLAKNDWQLFGLVHSWLVTILAS